MSDFPDHSERAERPELPDPTKFKPSFHRMVRYELYRLLNGQTLTRRDMLVAGGAASTAIAADKLFGWGLNLFAKEKAVETVSNSIKSINAQQFKQSKADLGRYMYLTPEKLGGGTHVVDLETSKTAAWISYWNYGDSCPISHHLAAYPSPDPYKGFEFVNSTQGGDNLLIYEIPTDIKKKGLLDKYGQGNNIYRVWFDGKKMNLVENVAESTGMGLGVHTTIYPDGNGFAGADGQKDIAAFFDRPALMPDGSLGKKTSCLAAFQADWQGTHQDGPLEDVWAKGGTLRITRLIQPLELGKFDLEGTKGNKIKYEMVPMGENFVYTGRLPGAGDKPKEVVKELTGLDAVVHHPGNRYSALIIRMLSCAVIVDRTNWEMVACLHNPEGSPGNIEVKKLHGAPDTWEVKFDDIKCVGHEAGFSPDGKFFTMMNNIKQNNMAVFDTSDPDPKNWKKITYVKDEKWVGEFPCPFHLCFSMDGSKMFVSVLDKYPKRSGCCVVDTKTWKITHKFPDIGYDAQTMAVSYDGKFVFQIFSGFQRYESGVFIFRQDTLEPYGYLPNFGGHHDCVIVPTKAEHLRNSRCTTL